MNMTFEVYGEYGTMTVEVETGKVVGYEPDNPNETEYDDIARIDIVTYESQFKLRINSGDVHDIFNFDFWLVDGSFCQRDFFVPTQEPATQDIPQPVIVYSHSTD